MTPEQQSAKDKFFEMAEQAKKDIAERAMNLKEKLALREERRAAARPSTGLPIRAVPDLEKQEGGAGNINPLNHNMKKGGKVSSASKRGDGCATKGKTKGRFV